MSSFLRPDSDFWVEKPERLFGHCAAWWSDAGSPAVVAIATEFPVAFAILVGAFTCPSALLMFLYKLGTALIGHRYWTLTGADLVESMDGFYKELSSMGGFLLLFITGAGKYSIDALRGIVPP